MSDTLTIPSDDAPLVPSTMVRCGRIRLSISGFKVDYFEARHAENLSPIHSLGDGPIRLLAAAWLGKTRLIDNIPV